MDSTVAFTPELIAAYQEQLKHPEENRFAFGYTILITFGCLGTIAIVLRLYARRYTSTSLGWDDAMALLAWMSLMALVGISLSCVPSARHIVFLKKDELERAMRSVYAGSYIYLLAVTAYKAAILHYYNRIFPTAGIRITIKCLLILVWLTYVACTLVLPFECKPLSHAWQLLTPGGCINVVAYALSAAIIGIVFDFIIFFLPIPLVWRLQMSLSKRLSIIGVFLLGALTLLSSIMRAFHIRAFVVGSDLTDPTFRNVGPESWTLAEVTTGVMCSCLPSIWPLILKVKDFLSSHLSRVGKSRTTLSEKTGEPISAPSVRTAKNSFITSTSTTMSAPQKSVTTSHLDPLEYREEEVKSSAC